MLKKLMVAAFAAGSMVMPWAANAQASAPKLPPGVHARFVTLPPHQVPGLNFPNANAGSLVVWSGKFKDLTGVQRTYTMVGTKPTAAASTTYDVIVIPVRMVYGSNNGNHIFDPTVDTDINGATVIDNTLASPLFTSSVDFVQGGVDLGATQYIDAFQRGNFWRYVSLKRVGGNYHLLFNPVSSPVVTINVTPSQGSVVPNPFAPGNVGTMDINSFDSAIQTFMSQNGLVNPGVLPLFVTDNVFLTSGGCCIGGYHSANGGTGSQTYSVSTYVTSAGSFSQDVSALSHELGEWLDDPYVNNRVGCHDNSILEVGDPLEGRANYGGFPYTVNGFTYNLQSMVYIGYFGAKPKTSVNGWLSFQNDEKNVCPGQ